eukprot:Gregarina_sp_Poly_1__9898@NODE_646_length_6978_cov_73_701490_g492_i0_p7_GENE_NODE_646_length_6978_cov_73_701490_g492_i0NODE_646_length_6978_cov_73_701490_g492_i0_p7_ORF_typecomplete_len119_score14_04_NODE_646_length_6978_cov_73_701490_g492_i035533909
MTFEQKATFAQTCEGKNRTACIPMTFPAPWPCAGYIAGFIEPPVMRGTWQKPKLYEDKNVGGLPFLPDTNFKPARNAQKVLEWMYETYIPNAAGSDQPDPVIMQLPNYAGNMMPDVPP